MSLGDARGLDRIGTGHPESDQVLHGGFPAGSTNIIMGPPGTGKTILAQQLLFHNAGGDRPVIFLATLSEPLSKVLTYLQQFSFYDESAMLDSLVYEDVGAEILEEGVDYLLERVDRLLREERPRILVIDSFKAIHDLTESPVQMRRLSAELGARLAAVDITTFLIGEYVEEDVSTYPEFAVADGVIQLSRTSSEKRDERHFRILKLRGSAYDEGLHSFKISEEGLSVYPRLVSPPEPPSYELPGARVGLGIAELDALMEGGLLRATTGLVLGAAGTGKTTLGLEFVLSGVDAGEPGLYVNFQENPSQIAATIRRRGLNLGDYEERGLQLLYRSPVELQIDSLVVELFALIRSRGIRRVVIDALGDLQLSAISEERFHDYLYSLTQHFAVNGVTTLLTLEARHAPTYLQGPQAARLSTLCDTLIALDLDQSSDPPRRTLRIVKSRGSAHALEPQRFRITETGLELGPDASLG